MLNHKGSEARNDDIAKALRRPPHDLWRRRLAATMEPGDSVPRRSVNIELPRLSAALRTTARTITRTRTRRNAPAAATSTAECPSAYSTLRWRETGYLITTPYEIAFRRNKERLPNY